MPSVTFAATDGIRLEGRLTRPSEPHGGAAVLCHPHPRHGGSMDSWMLPIIQRTLVADGWIGLRFDFRGVGGSGGTYGRGVDELHDVAGAVDFAIAQAPPDPALMLLGWSFGALMSLRHATGDGRCRGWVGIGVPYRAREVEMPDLDVEALSRWTVPKLFIHGDQDQFTPIALLQEVVDAAAEPKRLYVIAGGDHYLAGRGDVLGNQAVEFGRDVLARR